MTSPSVAVTTTPMTVTVIDHAGTVTAAGGSPSVTVSLAGIQGPSGDGSNTAAVVAHEADTTPHPAYDDLPSLAIIFENGLV